MAKALFSDNAATTATSSLSSGGTSLTLTSSAKFPVPTGGDYFYATLYQKPSATEINIEIVKVTANNTGTNTLTISQRDVTNITGFPGSGYAYPGASGTVYVELRWIASDANLLMQAADMTAANVTNTPAGNIAATTVQAALNELDTEKAPLASPAFTGSPTVGGSAIPTASDISTAVTGERSAIATLTNKTLDSSTCKIGALSGIIKTTAGAPAAATVRVDYAEPTTALATGILKNTTTTGAHSIAVVRTDYAEPTTALATGILKNTTTTGAHSIAVAGTDYQAPIGTISGIAKGNGANALIAATAGTDYVAPGGALGTPSSGTLTNCTFPTLNQNTTGTAAGLSATLVVGSGGTGLTAAGASGNVLTSNGTAWVSQAPAGGGVTSVGGNTGAVTNAQIATSAIAGGAANASSVVPKDFGAGSWPIGSIVTGAPLQGGNSTITHSAGSSYAGSTIGLYTPSYSGGSVWITATALIGTWRVIGSSGAAYYDGSNLVYAGHSATAYQRIA